MLSFNHGDLVKCVHYMRSLALYSQPGVYNLYVGELHCDDIALVVSIADNGLTVAPEDRYKALLLTSRHQILGWCESSNLLRRHESGKEDV